MDSMPGKINKSMGGFPWRISCNKTAMNENVSGLCVGKLARAHIN
jgi:hypothetical protein